MLNSGFSAESLTSGVSTPSFRLSSAQGVAAAAETVERRFVQFRQTREFERNTSKPGRFAAVTERHDEQPGPLVFTGLPV